MIVSELRSAFRTLLQRPQFTCVSVLLLALGVGATTVLFALADAAMFRPFPFADQDRLVIGAEHRAGWTRAEVSYASSGDAQSWRQRRSSRTARASTSAGPVKTYDRCRC
jgi:hypothetical protein